MPDHIDKYTDQQEAAYARKIAATYKQAAQEVRRQITEFTAKHKAKAAKLLQQVNAGEISMADYQAWLQGQVFMGKQWQTKLDDIVRVYTEADEKARQLMRGTVRDVFTESANYAAYQLEGRLGAAVDFHLYDAKTVDRLMRTDPQMLPEWKINEPKDYKWNAQRVRSTLTRAIIQGKPIPDIAEELGQQLATGNAKKMVLFARTAMTGAQNAGRVERLHDTQQMGIRVKKKWLAAHDARVRDTHAYLDGQERDVDDDFTVGDMHIAYPGDPTAPPELVYNCRCSMIYVYPEHQAEHQGEKTESYEEWLEEKRGKKEEQEEQAAAENVTKEQETEPEPTEKSFAETIASATLSPHPKDYTPEEYDELMMHFEGERTDYLEDVCPDAEVKLRGKRSAEYLYEEEGGYCEAGRIDNTLARLYERIPPIDSDRIIVCEYEDAWQYLPEGKDDRRFHPDDAAAAQVFKNEGQMVVAINRGGIYYTTEESIRDRAERLERGETLDFVFGLESPETVLLHEYGHILHPYYTHALVYRDEDALAMREWFSSLTKDEIRSGLSDYATESFGEFCAECFAELNAPNPRPIALKYWEYMQRLIAKKEQYTRG